MSISRLRLTALVVLGSAAAPAAAQTEKQQLEQLFKSGDRDGDGAWQRAEFPGSDEQFAALDRDRDRAVTLAEFQTSTVARALLAARRTDRDAPRPRADQHQRRAAQLAVYRRFDRNGDGRVQPAEWTGAATAFTELDLDRNGVLDSADRRLADRRAAATRPDSYDDVLRTSSSWSYPPRPEEVLERRDRDRDQLLSRREAAADPKLARLFDLADTSGDAQLDLPELRAMIAQVASRLAASRRLGAGRVRAYVVPFSTWDKNDDGRIDTAEWLEQRYLFPRLDLDRDGAVTREEVARYKLSVEGEDFVARFDLDHDGAVSRPEFAGPRDAFRRADRNGDGLVTRSDR